MRSGSFIVAVVFIGLMLFAAIDAARASDSLLLQDQDTAATSILSPPEPDTTNIPEDSLEKLVPYLDDVKNRTSASGFPYLIIIAIALSSLVSEDLACIGAGLMVAQGLLEFWPAASGAILGIFVGDFSLYFAGRILGSRVFDIAPFKWFLKKEIIRDAEKWFDHKGPTILVISRFIPGSRLPVYLSAGLLKTSFWKFSLYFGLTALLWTPIFVWLSVFAGNEILSYYNKYDDYAVWIMLVAGILLFVLFKYLLPLLTARGRRIAWEKLQSMLNR